MSLTELPQEPGHRGNTPSSPRNAQSHHEVRSSKVAVSWVGSFGGRALRIQVGLMRSRTRHTKEDSGQASSARPPRVRYRTIAAEAQIPPGSPDSSPVPESTAVVSFWNSLTPDERRAFRAMAGRRVFAAGARLMREGEHANHVAVILDGWTEIRVSEHDRERVVARRGPGQLVGERAALQISVRSATVVAIQPVEALVMYTKDFAAFVSNHPGALDIVENQIFSRMRERPASYDGVSYESGDDLNRGAGRATLRPAPWPRRSRLTGENCTVLRTDVVAFSADNRNDEDRAIIRRETMTMTQRALGVARDLYWFEDRGDGHLIIAPPSIPTVQAIQGLLAGLARELRRHNHIYSDSVQVRLRVAVDVGPVTEDISGVSGKAIISVSRMMDTPAFTSAMAETGAVLGIVVSPFVYETAIRQSAGPPEPISFSRILVELKETRASAWMHLIEPDPSRSLMRLCA